MVLDDVKDRDSYGTFSDDDIAGLRSEASAREIARSNPRFIEEHEKPFHLPWFTKIMIAVAVLGFCTIGTLLLCAFFSGKLGMMSVTKGDLAKLSAMSGVPGVKQSRLYKDAVEHKNAGRADLSIYGTRIPKPLMKPVINMKVPDIAGDSLTGR